MNASPWSWFFVVTCSFVHTVWTENWHFTGPNIALNKQATQWKGTILNGYAGRAVDGNTITNFIKGTCTHTEEGVVKMANWTVDLGQSYYIKGVRIYNRHMDKTNQYYEQVTERLKGFYIIGSDPGHDVLYNDTVGINNGEQYKNTIINISLEPTSYQKLTIQLPPIFRHVGDGGFAILTLCEVQIYAALCEVIESNLNIKVIADDNDIDIINGKQYITYGTTIRFECIQQNGYELVGKSIATCLKDGTYDTDIPECKKVCSPLPSITNGEYIGLIDINTRKFYAGDEVQWKCNKYYEPEQSTRICNQNGQWHPEPDCTAIQCTYPSVNDGNFDRFQFENGSIFEQGAIIAGSSLYVFCIEGYIPNNEKIVCSSNRQWTQPISCEIIKCESLTRENGIFTYMYRNVSELSKNTYVYGTTATLKCNAEFRLASPSNNLKCGHQNGSWEGEDVSCVATCKAPKALHGRYVDGDGQNMTTYDVGHAAILMCDDGYDVGQNVDTTEIECSGNHTWLGQIFNCSKSAVEASPPSSSTGNAVGGVVGGAVGGLVAVLVVIILIVFLKRRRKPSPKQRYQHTSPNSNSMDANDDLNPARLSTLHEAPANMPGAPFRADKEEEADGYYCFTNPLKLPAKGIKLEDLADFVLKTSATSDKYTKEFQGFPDGMKQPHQAALKNRAKNRYKNIYAYDVSRVVLEVWNPPVETDYINACYIHGYNTPKMYIASQGATKENINDIWRMIWQLNCGKIAMLTNIREEGKVKCEQYWPDEGTQVYGSISVTAHTSEVFSNFVIRAFTVCKDNKDGRRILQFHFTAWPDRGVPKFCSSLVHFRNKVKTTHSPLKGPLVVHCSAGIGRTGTYIAIDYLTDQGQALGFVDVKGCVETLRRQRVNLVQTKEQYIFVHQTLVETLMLSTSALSTSEFPDVYKRLKSIDPVKGQRNIDVEYEVIGSMSPVAEESQYASAKDIKNRHKNRYNNILPVEDFMPSLFEPGYSENGGYINAVFLPSYKEHDALVITQTPLETTKEDFWKMVFHQKVHTIVMVNHESEMKDAEIYWPRENEKIVKGELTITHSKYDSKDGHEMVTMTVEFQNLEPRTVTLLQFGGWPGDSLLPDSPNNVLTALDIVLGCQRQTGNNPVIVHCMNGVDKSGLFCVLYALLERTKIEHDVALPQMIQEMRNRRQQIIPNVKQFEFCYDVVSEYLKQFETYSNFSEL